MDDLSVQVALTCPTCGFTEFAYETPAPGQGFTDDWVFTCGHCERSLSRAELIEANAESIDTTVSDMGDDIVDALAKDLKKALKKQGWEIR
ncbi:hypothetical protein [Adlercreutzia sp. ZJ154]|uniref:ECs_2282 family putative zinc-binding protein n=1 Tax=Adlercreutzia sp. ZJ154 TaxID=2709790 RepID=UPI0013E9EEB1|nr:hypothetical protein [Adlercreutzia sp. ZJ154]